jgi:aspartate 1-decarboxylase
MQINVLKSKIHIATITEANLHYVGSITIDEDLMDAANLIQYEQVLVVNINNAERFDTYILTGKRGSGVICMNGPSARLCAVGDKIIIMSYAAMDFELAKSFHPTVIFPKDGNKL